MPPIRECDRCHSKMPFGRRRMRTEQGELICPGCAAGAPGTRMHGGRVQASLPSLGEQVTLTYRPEDVDGDPVVEVTVTDVDEQGLTASEPAFDVRDDSTGEEWTVTAREVESGIVTIGQAMRRVAHDSGDGETIYHCPFCGGGQVWARSDGTTQCDFCSAAFTVQVQPLRSAMPQTVNGQPVDVPGMPGSPGTPEQAAPEAGTFQPPEAPAPAFDPPVEQVTAHYVTASGGVLPEESFLRHLAIAHADDPPAVIAEVRADRASRG